jgi:hypothetical protein
MFSPHRIARGEYRFADFGTTTNVDTRIRPAGACSTVPSLTRIASYGLVTKTHTVNFAVAYKFGP